MKVKNLVLFGFVSSALNYLANQEDDGRYSDILEMSEVDFERIKREVGDKMGDIVEEYGEAASTLVNIGNDAFKRYISANEYDDFDDFDDFFADRFEELDYDEEDEFDEEFDDADEDLALIEEIEELMQEELESETEDEEEDEFVLKPEDVDIMIFDEEETLENLSEDLIDSEGTSEEVEEFNEEDFYNEIAQAVEKANRSAEERAEAAELREQEALEAEEPVVEVKVEEDETAEEEVIDFDEIFGDIFDNVSHNEAPEAVVAEADSLLKQAEEAVQVEIDPFAEEEVVEEEIMAEIIADEPEEELLNEAEEEVELVPADDEIYQQISNMYAYLEPEFIRSVYDLKDVIAANYPLDEAVIVLHRINFDSLEDLRQFVEIVSNHGYNVNVDENKMIVDIFRRYINSDGKILTNIFEIANQANLLRGHYEGYRIDIVEEES